MELEGIVQEPRVWTIIWDSKWFILSISSGPGYKDLRIKEEISQESLLFDSFGEA